jgi:hypothetical protein
MKTVFHSQGKGDEGEPDHDDDGNFLGPRNARVQDVSHEDVGEDEDHHGREKQFREGHEGEMNESEDGGEKFKAIPPPEEKKGKS